MKNSSYRKYWRIVLVLFIVGIMALAPGLAANDFDGFVEWGGYPQGADSEEPGYIGDGPRTEDGWIHWVLTGNNSNIEYAEVILGGTGSGEYPAEEDSYGSGSLHFFTPYFELDGLEAIAYYTGTAANNVQLIISDYYSGTGEEELIVSKTVETFFTRQHLWDIDKEVTTENEEFLDSDPKIWLFIDGSGDELATWNIDVTYLGFEDSDFNVSGTVTIENTGTIPAVLTGYEDFLGGVEIDVDFGVDFPHILAEGETLEGTYSEEGFFEGMNEVTIMTTKDEYSADAEILWEDPDEEINAVVTIEDDSDFFGLEELGTVDSADLLEGDVVNFNYDHLFEYGLYEGPAVIENTAKIVESGQKASAILKINTQEFIYESAWAKGDGAVSFTDSGFSNWGWTNPIEEGTHEMDLWAGAAQSDTSKGTLVGTVTVVYNGGIDVTFNLDYGHTLEESHVYAGDDMFPQQRVNQQNILAQIPHF